VRKRQGQPFVTTWPWRIWRGVRDLPQHVRLRIVGARSSARTLACSRATNPLTQMELDCLLSQMQQEIQTWSRSA
jgi:hypothetical protein